MNVSTNKRSNLKIILYFIAVIFIFIAGLFFEAVLIHLGISLANKIYPILIRINSIFTFISLFVFLPLSAVKRIRKASVYGLILSIFIFGASLWVYALLTTYYFWGGTGVFIGLTIVPGIGVIPLAFIAAILNQAWVIVGSLIYSSVLLFGTIGVVKLLENRIN